jgi:tetratricopeptide (TPR) repeat protein
MRMFSSRAVAVLVAGLSLVTLGCGQVGMLQAKMAFRDANTLYSGQDYRGAAAKYEEAIAADPNLTEAYFFLGNSYDNLYRPARRGEAANDELLTKAVSNYKRAAESAQDPKIRQLALEYLVAAYGADKLNDTAQQEPLVQEMIKLNPNEPTNYFALAKIYEDNGDYEAAEQTFLKAKEVRPQEPTVYTQLAGFYNRQGDFDKTIVALQERTQREPNNPEAHHLIATYYWDKVYRDFRLPDTDKRKYIEAGIMSEDKAIELKSDYFEAITYKNLLLRLQANVEKDPARQQALLREADRLRDQAQELRKKQQAGAAGE